MSYAPTQQMQMSQPPATSTGEWKHGLFSCFDDCGLCLQTTCCPCITFGQNASKLGGSCCMCCCVYTFSSCVAWILGTSKRGEIRARYGIRGGTCGDCCTHLCCTCCALIQEAQQLKE
ncbi:PLAC8-domain-containing protein [Rhizophagus irregularis]|uniref:Uncharacterized protein n=3 Tax=Rhizophagus irregularis TaxID=588596 RepID=U9TNC4_RHIID|nr:hypothetical protein GLOIN_2v1590065 [Rhizophagus irregularis DAOM 181602=DAOM 197198]EXX59445.1 hypothetical protein RirG_188990 [Rhizophagus irregularis DAOM 197198w]PKC01577.1 PLAC8-domain-containing protein [Rhizophagus irregularis]PKC66886.1 PLAC8-domain-containing protein [Rhizophagus irregularis]PKK77684.1 PLAC8-domain-containing protein [Rhizophagus irregularis]PKY21223.1 PLAC8-domain-containing protein [Rhizophagus irregularis]|eukprot:XP_025179900.1 hypothetical protein GLOIN_2v1590065 [Rhizophagus irregularis DAOM 181602=DAOM 197198]